MVDTMLNGLVDSAFQNRKGSGSVFVSGNLISWAEINGEIQFSTRNSDQSMSIGELHLTANEQLQVVNQLLAHVRPFTIPDGNSYHAASAGITAQGHLYIDVPNMQHIVEQFAGRGCAETGMLRKAEHWTQDAHVQFSAVYLMSGIAHKDGQGGITEQEKGHIGCPCGECRQNLRHHTQNATFFMLPTNDGSIELITHKGEQPPRNGGHTAWEISPAIMYPMPEYETAIPAISKIMQVGYDYATTPATPEKPLVTHLDKLVATASRIDDNIVVPLAEFMKLKQVYESVGTAIPALHDHPTEENVNRALLQLIKKAYASHHDKLDEKKNIEITAIILKTRRGEFFPGVLVNGDLWLPSKPPEIPVALTNAYNQTGIEEVFMMNFNDQKMLAEMGASLDHEIKMPDPAGLNRLIKNLGVTDNPVLTVIPLNDGSLNEQQIEAIATHLNVRTAFGPNYTNPKRIREQQLGTAR